MVNGSQYYTALESVSIASALSSALIIYQYQIRIHQRWQSELQLLTARKKGWRLATADSLPQAVTCQHCDRHYFSRPRTHNLPIVSPSDAVPIVPPRPQCHRGRGERQITRCFRVVRQTAPRSGFVIAANVIAFVQSTGGATCSRSQAEQVG